MEINNFTIFKGSSPIIRLALLQPEPITGWTTKFYVMDKATQQVVFTFPGTIADINDVPLAETMGIFDVTLLADQTNQFIGNKIYDYAFWRVDENFETPLASGSMRVKVVTRPPTF
jgi:hypothetical protein